MSENTLELPCEDQWKENVLSPKLSSPRIVMLFTPNQVKSIQHQRLRCSSLDYTGPLLGSLRWKVKNLVARNMCRAQLQLPGENSAGL